MTNKNITFLAAMAALFLGVASSDAGRPANAWIDAPDPTAIRDGDWWYVYTTGPGIIARRTKDFVDWEMLPTVLDEDVPSWAKVAIPQTSAVWAPDIGFFNERFFLIYSISFWGSQRSLMGVLTAETLDPDSEAYGWRDEGLLLESFPEEDDFNAIDGSLAIDVEGDPWLVWGSHWSGIKLTRLDSETGRVTDREERHSLADSPRGIEAPQIVHRNGWYYLFVSHAGGFEYQVLVGRSRNITGPYRDRRGLEMMEGGGTPVTTPTAGVNGPGHHGLALGDPELGDVFLSHVFNRFSRDLYVASLHWMSDGWPVAGEAFRERNPRIRDLRAHVVENRWVMVNGGANIGTSGYYKLTLYPDGKASGVTASARIREGSWEMDGNELWIRWPGDVVGGAWVDHLHVAADGTHLAGRNQFDLDVRGVPETSVFWRRPVTRE